VVVGRELAAVVAVDARVRQLEGGHRLAVAGTTAAAISAALTRMPVLARSSDRSAASARRALARRVRERRR
jgi:hypothetical protein